MDATMTKTEFLQNLEALEFKIESLQYEIDKLVDENDRLTDLLKSQVRACLDTVETKELKYLWTEEKKNGILEAVDWYFQCKDLMEAFSFHSFCFLCGEMEALDSYLHAEARIRQLAGEK